MDMIITNPPIIITSYDQLPHKELLVLYPNNNCIFLTLTKYPPQHLIRNPYADELIRYFLLTSNICSDSFCVTIPYCHVLWFALEISNRIKKRPCAQFTFINDHIHPILPFDENIHILLHA